MISIQWDSRKKNNREQKIRHTKNLQKRKRKRKNPPLGRNKKYSNNNKRSHGSSKTTQGPPSKTYRTRKGESTKSLTTGKLFSGKENNKT